jgi:prolyl-tRNA synthetase
MRYARALIPTLKEAPSDAASVSHVLLLRAGYARKVGNLYSYLPLGVRVLRKLENLVRAELEPLGALELRLPSELPAETTPQDLITDLARREIRSYRDLPKLFYRLERENDSYSVDADEPRAEQSYAAVRAAYERICQRLGLEFRIVNADSAAGARAEEFQVLLPSGEDELAACLQCPYAATLDAATSPPYPRRGPPLSELPPPERLHTPGHGRIEDVVALTKLPVQSFLKSLVYGAGSRLVLAVVRGDHSVNEAKLARALGVDEVKLASADEVRRATGAAVGFAGPVGFAGKVVVDRDAASVADGVAGANETDYHWLHVAYGRDFEGQVADIRTVVDGDLCPECGASLKLYRGLEIGRVSLLGALYAQAGGATYLDETGAERPLHLGSYSFNVSRLLTALVEQHHDDSGLRLPMAVAPFQVLLVQLGTEPAVLDAVTRLERELETRGVELLVDDRDERPGVKFKDCDLLGVPLRVTVGKKSLENGGVELKQRSERNPQKSDIVPLDRAAEHILELVQRALPGASQAA